MLKYARAICISFAVGAVCGGVLLYVVRNSKPQTITIHDGKVEYVEKTVYKITTNTGGCCNDYNNLLADYNLFTTAPPVFTSADDKRIYFSIAKNQYSLAYAMPAPSKLSIAPMVGASVNYDNLLSPTVCLGVNARYDAIGLSLVVSARNVSLLASWSFEIK